MKPLRRLTNLLAACAVTAAAFGQPALAADLRNDPVVQDLLRRENFDRQKILPLRQSTRNRGRAYRTDDHFAHHHTTVGQFTDGNRNHLQ